MADLSRLQNSDHTKSLLARITENRPECDLRIHCLGGFVDTHRLLLAAISPFMRGLLIKEEETSISLPDIERSELITFLEGLCTEGSFGDHQVLLHLFAARTDGAIYSSTNAPSCLPANDPDGGSTEIAAAVRSLAEGRTSSATWNSTAFQLVSNVKHDDVSQEPCQEESPGLAEFQSVAYDCPTTDIFDQCFLKDNQLQSQCLNYIKLVDGSYNCAFAKCSYSSRKLSVLKYHVLRHLRVRPFAQPRVQRRSYVDFIKSRFNRKSSSVQTEDHNEVTLINPGDDNVNDAEMKETVTEDDKPTSVSTQSRVPRFNDLESIVKASIIDDLQPEEDDFHMNGEDNLQDDSHEMEEHVENSKSEKAKITNGKQQPKGRPRKSKVTMKTTSNGRKPVKSSKASKKKVETVNGKDDEKSEVTEVLSDKTKAQCHQYIVFDAANRVYNCTFASCSYSHRSKTSLRYHVMKHLDITEYLCDECGEAFPNQNYLRKHVISVHGSEELRAAIEKWIVEDQSNPGWYRCSFSECAFAAATKKGAGMHALNQHMEKTFICDLCGEGFVTEKTLSSHTNYHNKNKGGEKMYNCNFCEKSFKTPSYLEAHENEHRGVRPYQCDSCGKSFASSGMLRSHKFAHAPKIFKCDCCDQAFPRRTTLMVHLRAVHMHEKPYECDICGQRFPRSSSMTRHRRIHTGLPRYQCHYCEKTTTQRGDLNRHMTKAHGWTGGGGVAEQAQHQQPHHQPLQEFVLT